MLTDAAFNALLKTLEEPPPHVVFILATTEAHKVPATIVSRCQRFDFRRMSLASSVRRLQQICEGEGITCETAALEMIARQATGSLRDAINLLDQLATSYGYETALTVDLVRAGPRACRRREVAPPGAGSACGRTRPRPRTHRLGPRRRPGPAPVPARAGRELRALLLVKSGLEPADGATPEASQRAAGRGRRRPRHGPDRR